ncbi:MAG: heavy-metal-associated domain-containing protein [Oligoflexales bacterium]
MWELKTEGMTCNHCIKAITNAVKDIDDKAEVSADLTAQTIKIDSSRNLNDLIKSIEEQGYPIREKKGL